ncbi:hypothetical protein [Providencia burhodogranariea]|uniref:Type VI secretion protein n=1 Tax=Providencia burhodogranariea DSM 19968 TaxID=1141662 RepID=K8WGH7_9GAMM|nr:hypothetical protein [Providencia burhodogranariea]EKT59659.1 hypothetical protein OOA_13327 [Providencia burhodogranariea DSM 19968]
MISWNVPSLEHPPKPKIPQLMVWLFIMFIIGICGFGLGIYLSENGMIPPNMGNSGFILVFVVAPILLTFAIRLLVYSLASYRHQLFTNMLDDAKQEWRYWADKHLGVLAHSRLTQIDEENNGKLNLSSLTPNKENKLTLNTLKSLPEWDKPEIMIQTLLLPIAEYYQQYGLTQPITLYWQAEKGDTDWLTLIQYETARLSLDLESVEALPYESLSEWLLALYDKPFEPKLYAILAFQLNSLKGSEEVSSLLLAPQGIYERLRTPVKAKLLRPISTDANTFSDALKTQCEFQCSGQRLDGIWQSGITDNNKGTCITSYTVQNVAYLSEHLYDTDMFLGKGSIARHAVALSLACEYPHHNLVVYQDKERYLLQQVRV